MSREAALWTWLGKARLALPTDLHMNRIENWLEAGTPDVEGYIKLPPLRPLRRAAEGQFWFELKSTPRPVKSETPVRFHLKRRDKQIEWMRRRWDLGGNAFWLLQVGESANRRLYLAPGNIGALLKKGITEAQIAVECLGTGVFNHRASQLEILESAVTCRLRIPQ